MDWRIQHHDGAATLRMLDELSWLYKDAYPQQPENDNSIHQRENFINRTKAQAEHPGFHIVTAHPENSDEIIGCSFGFPFEAGRWWGGALDKPDKIVELDNFAVIELIVQDEWRGRKIGRALMDALLAERVETYATLLALPASPARDMYARWGWQPVGRVRSAEDAPVMDALAFALQ